MHQKLRPAAGDGRPQNGLGNFAARPSKAIAPAEQVHAGNGASCADCGKTLHPKRGSRRQRYCDAACRKSANRALKMAARYPYSGVSRSVQNNNVISIACKGHFDGRASHIYGPARVIAREVFAGLDWQLTTSPDGIVVMVSRLGRAAS